MMCAGLALAAPAMAQDDAPADLQEDMRPALALMGTIPIYWGEAESFGDLLDRDRETHWARPVIESDYRIAPLDYLSTEALAPHRKLLLAQPRGLSAEENVALDAWVRAGGRLLLFADPMMTGETRFALGDRRRPQDVALLSPIFAHWGLALEFDDRREVGLEWRQVSGRALPVNLPGRLAHLADSANLADSTCVSEADGLITSCVLGLGEAVILADAAILDFSGPYLHAETGLKVLMERIFVKARDNAGQNGEASDSASENGGIARFSGTAAGASAALDPP